MLFCFNKYSKMNVLKFFLSGHEKFGIHRWWLRPEIVAISSSTSLKRAIATASDGFRPMHSGENAAMYVEEEDVFQIPNLDKEVKPENLLRNLQFNLKSNTSVYKSHIENILKYVESRNEINSEQGICLLESSAFLILDQPSETKAKLIWKIWMNLKKIGAIHLESYHSLLRCLTTNKEYVNMDGLLREMKHSGLAPNEETYLLALNCLCENGRVDEAVALVQTMKQLNFKIGQRVFNDLALVFSKTGNDEKALNVLDMMSQLKMPVTLETNVSLLRGFAESSKEDNFNKIFKRTSDTGMKLPSKHCLAIIKSLAHGKMYHLIPKVLNDQLEWASHLPIAFNACINLLHEKEYEAAFPLIRHLFRFVTFLKGFGEMTYAEYLVQEMIKSETPLKFVLEFCQDLKEKQPYLLHKATYVSLRFNLHKTSISLFEVLNAQGHPLRPHFFWPIFISSCKNGEPGTLGILTKMLNMGVRPDIMTLESYIYPGMCLSDPKVALRKLQDMGLPVSLLLAPLISTMLKQGKLKEALELVSAFKTRLEFDHVNKSLVSAFISGQNVNYTMDLLNVFGGDAGSDFLDAFLSKRDLYTPELLKKLLNGYANCKISLNWTLFEKIKNYMHSHDLQELENEWLRGLLKNADYTDQEYIPHPEHMTIPELEDHLIQLKSKGMNTRQVLRRLMINYCARGDLKRVLGIIKELEEQKKRISPGMWSSLIELYCKHNDVDKAFQIFKQLRKDEPSFSIDHSKYLLLAAAFAENDNIEKAFEIIAICPNMAKYTESLSLRCFHLLKSIAERYGPEKVKKMLELLNGKGFCQYTNVLLGPIIKGYLIRGDIEGAALEYLNYIKEHGIGPLRFELLCKLSVLSHKEKRDDKKGRPYTDLLKQVLCATETLYGKDVTNSCYVAALAEMNLVNELQSFIAKSHWEMKDFIFWNECNRISEQMRLSTLLNMFKVMTRFQHINVEPVYMNILKIYSRRGDCKSALTLLNMVEECGLVPSQDFLKMLASLLQSHKQEVPFVL